ncbi:MAG: Ig-like domain-containing protein, partial [Acidimicrobiales bacterium]
RLCGAVDASGNVVSSTNPPGGASAWTAANVDGTNFLHGVSCPSVSLCVAVDDAGNVIVGQAPSLAATTTSVRSSSNPSAPGQPVTFTATVAPQSVTGTPSGTVTFYDGTTALGTGVLDGANPDRATLSTSSLSTGTHSITASYGGDSTYAGSTSKPLSQVVGSHRHHHHGHNHGHHHHG